MNNNIISVCCSHLCECNFHKLTIYPEKKELIHGNYQSKLMNNIIIMDTQMIV